MKNQFEVLDKLESSEEIDINAWVRELTTIHMRHSASERAYKIIRMYFDSKEMNSDLHDKFIIWLTSEYESEAKDWAMDRVFEEIGTDRIERKIN